MTNKVSLTIYIIDFVILNVYGAKLQTPSSEQQQVGGGPGETQTLLQWDDHVQC